MMSPKRLAIFAGYAAMGPITSFCIAGFVRNMRGGAPILAVLYLVLMASGLAALSVLTGQMALKAAAL